jgi:hypothetical protein
MTTAIETTRNVKSFFFIIDVRSNNPRTTAELFVDNNIRHLVTRRMKWTEVELFVTTALLALVTATSGNITGASVDNAVEFATETIRDALNRRRTWNDYREFVITDVMDVIAAAERLL